MRKRSNNVEMKLSPYIHEMLIILSVFSFLSTAQLKRLNFECFSPLELQSIQWVVVQIMFQGVILRKLLR